MATLWVRLRPCKSRARMQQLQGRWPAPLELTDDGERSIVANAFDNTPLLSGWARRPFELVTLRLQVH